MDAMKRDTDPQETREWLDALAGVLATEGPDRAHYLIEHLIDAARQSGAYLPFSANTAYMLPPSCSSVTALRFFTHSRHPWSSRLRQPVKGCLPTLGRGVPETMPTAAGMMAIRGW